MDIYNTECGFQIPPEHIPSSDDMKRYKDGDPTIINVLVEGLTKYIIDQVNFFLISNPSAQPYTEDCLSEALLMLQEFTTNQLGKEFSTSKFIGHAKQSVLNQIKCWLRENTKAVKIPAKTQKRTGQTMMQRKLGDHLRQSDKDAVFNEVWFHQFFEKLPSIDKKIAQLKIQGESNREISRQLGMDHHTVKTHLERMQDIYEGNTV